MEKTIKVDNNTSFRISNNIGWLMEYQNQFGKDILETLEPAMIATVGLVKSINDVAREQGVSAAEVIRALDADDLREAVIDLTGLGAVDIINITWAMAKAADEEVQEPREWVRQFDKFPLDVILPAVLDAALAGLMTTKKYKAARDAMQELRPSPSTPS